MNDRKLFKDVAKGMVLLLLALLACKYTFGGGALVLALIALGCAFTGKIGWALGVYILFPFMVVLNPLILPMNGIMPYVVRITPMVMSMTLVIASASRHGHHQIPLGMIWPFLGVAMLCSVSGYYPKISYLKGLNCAILFIGLNLGFRNIDKRPDDVMTIRRFCLVLSSFLIWGSVFLLVFKPSWGYMGAMRQIAWKGGTDADAVAALMDGGMQLFCGVTNQSQCLATMVPVSIAWIACDMFFIEKRLSKYHLLTIAAGLPLIYMTRSRSALLTSVVGACFIYGYCLRKVNLRPQIRRKVKSVMYLFAVVMVVAMGIMEVKDHSISKWIRKTDDLAGDQRGLGEAFTSSRQGLVENSMADFRANPLFGKGFQVAEYMQYVFKPNSGLILSASVEKGVLPVMVLGETGILGSFFFYVFIISFYVTCARKKYYCCATLHTVFLATNMAEATYFSPGGGGGYLWVICVGGGFVIDTVVLFHRRMEAILRQQQMMMMPTVR